MVGRFVNGDCLEAVTCSSCVLENNLFAYCNNDAINETDTHGNVAFKIFEKIIKGVIQGVLGTLCSDLISYLHDCFFVSQNTKFKSSTIKEYLLNVASCVLSSLISFSGVLDTCYKIILLIKEFLPKIVKGIMAVIDWVKMIAQILSIAVSKIISKILNKNEKKKLDALKKKRKKNSKNTNLKIEKKQIKFQYKKKGEKIDFCLEISDYLVMTFLDALVA